MLQGEYRLEAWMSGRWKQLLVKRPRLNGRAGYDDQVLASAASLTGAPYERRSRLGRGSA